MNKESNNIKFKKVIEYPMEFYMISALIFPIWVICLLSLIWFDEQVKFYLLSAVITYVIIFVVFLIGCRKSYFVKMKSGEGK